MVERKQWMAKIEQSILQNPVTAILGPRQCGKTFLARIIHEKKGGLYLDLETPEDIRRLENPLLTLRNQEGMVIIDEIQRSPHLFSILRVLADDPENHARFLILGSASPSLIKHSSDSLAGRMGFINLSGFSISEVGDSNCTELWIKGGFPRSYLAGSIYESSEWRNNFIRTFLERDIPQLGIVIPSESMRRFWTMLAHYHGNTWNAAEFARALGVSEAGARKYLDILTGSYAVRQIQPWFENIKKRQVKAPRIYIKDSGILHTLLSLGSKEEILGHPKGGASWEGFIVEQIIVLTGSRDIYYWSVHSGAELDLLFFHRGKRYGFEIKLNDAPGTTKSMRSAIETLKLDHLYIVYPGENSFPLDQKISLLSIDNLSEIIGGIIK